jgi:hypothetical protein
VFNLASNRNRDSGCHSSDHHSYDTLIVALRLFAFCVACDAVRVSTGSSSCESAEGDSDSDGCAT